MKILSKISKKHSSFSQKLMLSYSALLILILLIGLYLYNVSSKNLQQSIEDQTELQLSYSISSLETSFDSMLSLSLSLARNAELSQLARFTVPDASNEFYSSAYAAQKSLSNYSAAQNLLPVSSYFIYLSESGYILTPSSFSTAELYYKRMNLSSNSLGHWADTLTNPQKYRTLIPMSEFNDKSDDFLYILPLNTYIFYEIQAQLCMIVSYAEIEKFFAPLTAQSHGALYALSTEDRSSVFSINTGDYSVSKDFWDSLKFRSDIAHCTLRGEKVSVLRQLDSSEQRIYYYILPYKTIQTALFSYRLMFLMVILAGLLVGFLLLFLLSRHNTRPYLLMSSQLQDSIAHARQLQDTLDFQQPLVHRSYVRNLMLGRISSQDEMNYIQSYLALPSTGKIYSVLYIVTYPNDQNDAAPDMPEYTDESGEFTYGTALTFDVGVISCLKEFFGDELLLFTPKKHNYALLIMHDEMSIPEAAHEILQTFLRFHDALLSGHAIWSIAGLGNYNRYPKNLWKSYQQATEAVSYTSSSSLICWYGSLELSSDLYYFPAQLSESLSNFITAGNQSQVAETFKFISSENLEKRSLSAPKMQCLLLEIYNALSRIRYSIPDDDAGDAVRAVDRRLNDYLSLKQLEDAASRLCAIFAGRTSQKQTISNIKTYIQDNYRDSSLCLTKLSDKFHLSESYLSYLFRESTGENFSVYLEHIRMEAALKLVRETSSPLSELYLETGYNNANSFRRVFKKTYGMSAKAMRDSLNA